MKLFLCTDDRFPPFRTLTQHGVECMEDNVSLKLNVAAVATRSYIHCSSSGGCYSYEYRKDTPPDAPQQPSIAQEYRTAVPAKRIRLAA